MNYSDLVVHCVKMNFFLNGIFLVTLCMFLPSNKADTSFGNFWDKRYPGMCVINSINSVLILRPGEKAPHPDHDCSRVSCGINGHAKIETLVLYRPVATYIYYNINIYIYFQSSAAIIRLFHRAIG